MNCVKQHVAQVVLDQQDVNVRKKMEKERTILFTGDLPESVDKTIVLYVDKEDFPVVLRELEQKGWMWNSQLRPTEFVPDTSYICLSCTSIGKRIWYSLEKRDYYAEFQYRFRGTVTVGNLPESVDKPTVVYIDKEDREKRRKRIKWRVELSCLCQRLKLKMQYRCHSLTIKVTQSSNR